MEIDPSWIRLWIPGNVPSLKNNKRIIPLKGQNRPMMIPSKRHEAYAKDTRLVYASHRLAFKNATEGLSDPLRVGFRFVRGSRHKFDYTNALDTVQDLMVKHGWIEDDNADCLIPVIIPYEYDKERPGVEIVIGV